MVPKRILSQTDRERVRSVLETQGLKHGEGFPWVNLMIKVIYMTPAGYPFSCEENAQIDLCLNGRT